MEESGFQVKFSPPKRGVQLPQMMGCWHLLSLFLVTTTPNLVYYVRLWVCRSSMKLLSKVSKALSAAPVIEEVWLEMNELVKQIFKDYEEIYLCGDGRNDSPGHSARYCVYTLVEHFTSAVVDFSVIDKRETGGNSTTMEKGALKRLLEKLAVAFPFQELTTDASPAVIKLARELRRVSKTNHVE